MIFDSAVLLDFPKVGNKPKYLFTLRAPIRRPCTGGNGRAVSGLARPPGYIIEKWRNEFNVFCKNGEMDFM